MLFCKMFVVLYSVKFVYIGLVPHPVLFVTHLWIHGMYVCVCVTTLQNQHYPVI